MKLRKILLPVVLVPILLVLLALAWREVAWRRSHTLLKPAAAAPDAAFVAEVRSLPESPLLAPRSSGVFVRKRWELLRSLEPQLVFVGACDQVDTRWMARRRLVIECLLRSGEPRLLQALVEDVVIELVIQPQFALAPVCSGGWPALPPQRTARSCS
ncbi:MAG TPA: hypothetical protein VFM98_17205 [Ramlibacter sp.]|uniref:hypothetical protein n=1 Tax=Ramlibacter sp. TaxID=1917967 RepID=UPI002D7E3101|nr:hypothetical protein [Ramlibacter sp.]HET8747340.1 hypothetical protein [Ramlibacter sp.]